ncbi:MAG: acyl-homoserine-lactone synthase [Hyphomonas sp.]
MFTIILPEQRRAQAALIGEMHRLRYRIVVEQWGWDIPGVRPGYDKDQFDTGDTVYVVVAGEAGRVLASARLNPTTRPHMMSELFAAYCDLQPYPVGADVWECSRFVIDTEGAADRLEAFRLRAWLGIGITTWCLDQGIGRLSWLTHQKFYNHVSGLFRTEPLGLPQCEGDDWAWIAAVSEVDLPALDRQLDLYRRGPEIVDALIAGRTPDGEGRAA